MNSAIEILPVPGRRGLDEARSFFFIGSHLFSRGVPVPEIYNYDEFSGRLVIEDLGDTSLYMQALDLVDRGDFNSLFRQYCQVLNVLAYMQVSGAEGFQTTWCWQEPVYDSSLAFEKEALYFLDAFIRDFLGIDCLRADLKEELAAIAVLVDDVACQDFFLHRDFQSRNIMLKDGRVRVIDFQAGRLGPLGYDLGSILHDPYVNIPWAMRQELFEYYLEGLNKLDARGNISVSNREFLLLSIMRQLQALGAYGFLAGRKKKGFFSVFMPAALETLDKLLDLWQDTRCHVLRECVQRARGRLS